MEDRPKIKFHLSPFDKKMEVAGFLLLLFMWCLLLFVYFKLPKIIPTHFGASGKPNDYGRKETLLLIPILGTILFFALAQLSKYPHIFNYRVKITPENAEGEYTSAVRIFRFLRIAILIIFTAIILITYLNVIGLVSAVGAWFLPMTFALLLAPTIIMIARSLRKK
ncbi:MAG: DUF1648 domain-containing protein [Ferruginibacter sp.]